MADPKRYISLNLTGNIAITIAVPSLVASDPPETSLGGVAEVGFTTDVKGSVKSVGAAVPSTCTIDIDASTQAAVSLTTPIDTLQPGAGWSGATAEPSQQGSASDYGYNSYPMSDWCVVPYRRVTGTTYIGVVAWAVCKNGYDSQGIAKVSFSVDNGTWIDVTTPATHPQTGVPCWFVGLDAADFTDGEHEIRCAIYPVAGKVRVLQGAIKGIEKLEGKDLRSRDFSLFIVTDNGGTLPGGDRFVDIVGGSDGNDGLTIGAPKKTILNAIQAMGVTDLGGWRLLLLDGNYTGGLGANRTAYNCTEWFTVEAAPGHEAVNLTAFDEEWTGHAEFVRYKDVTISAHIKQEVHTKSDNFIWFDTCELDGGNYAINLWVSHNQTGGMWANDCNIHDSVWGLNRATLQYNIQYQDIREDTLQGWRTAINVVSRGQNARGSGAHSDFAQVWNNYSDLILYKCDLPSDPETNCQGIAAFEGNQPITRYAIVECNVDAGGHSWAFALHAPAVTTFFMDKSVFVNGNGVNGFRNTPTFSDGVVQDSTIEGSATISGAFAGNLVYRTR